MSQILSFGDGGTVGGIVTITGDIGGAVSPDGAGDVVFTGGDNLTLTGTPGTNSFEMTIDDNFTRININPWFGSTIESAAVTVSSTITTITLSVEQSGGGDITVVFGDGYYDWDCTPADTVTLTAGTDINPVLNYVYLDNITKVLTASTAGWPHTGAATIATVLCQSAPSVMADGPYKMHAWTDHLSSTSTIGGHIAHLNLWIRQQYATWLGDVVPTLTITPQGAAPDNVIFTNTSGAVLQLHPHIFPAFTGTPDVYTVNDSTTAYNKVTDLNALLTDSTGATMSGRYFSLVIWGVVSEATGDCKLMVNLPSCSYGTEAQLQADVEKCVNYSMPADFKGTGFLIAQLNLRHQTASSGTWTEISVNDLRGQFPSTSAGGATTSVTEFADSTFRVFDDGDVTKEMAFEVSGVTTATTRTITMCDANLDLTSPSFLGSVTAATGMTITANDLDVVSGSINLPTTTATDGQITINGNRFVHSYGTDNTFIGNNAGNFTLTTSNAVLIGSGAGSNITGCNNLTAIGKGSLGSLTSGNELTTIGTGNAASIVSGCNGNTLIGALNLGSATTGTKCSYNVAVGVQNLSSLIHSTSNSSNNIAIGGIWVLNNITVGHSNIAIGSTNGTNNGAGYNLTSGDSSNILIHSFGVAGDNNTIRIGTQGTGSGQQDTTFIAGIYNATPTGGNDGIVITDSNGQLGSTLTPTVTSLTTTAAMTAGTGVTITTGDLDVTAGKIDLPATSSTAGQITVNGNRFLHSYGLNNTFLGDGAGNFTTTTSYNVGLGYLALNVLSGGNGQNLAFGPTCLENLTTGAYNTTVGLAAGKFLLTGEYNVIIGGHIGGNVYSGENYTSSESSNILIQNAGVVGDSNTIRIGVSGTGDAQQDKTFIAGIYNTTPTGGNDGTVIIDSNGQLGSVATLPASSGGRIEWTSVAGTTQAMSVNSGYINTNVALTTLTLPDTAAVGDIIRLVGAGSGGWKIAQNAGDTIHFGSSSTTTGTGGSLESTATRDTVELVCIIANTDFQVISSIGTITVT